MQQVSIRNKWVSLRGGSKVKDMNENDVFYVKGKFWTVTKKKFLQDMDGNLLYTIRNKFWTFFVHKAFIYDKDGQIVARIRRKFWSVHDRYFIESPIGQIEICGNILLFNYSIKLNGKEIGHISRKVSLRDSYVLTLDDDQDLAFFVAFAIAIDNITDQRREEAAASQFMGARVRRYCGQYILEFDGDKIREYCGRYIYQIDNGKIREYCGQFKYEISGNMVRRYCGPYILEMSGNRVRRYCGPYVAEIDGNRIREYCGQYLYEVDGFLTHEQWLALITLLFA